MKSLIDTKENLFHWFRQQQLRNVTTTTNKLVIDDNDSTSNTSISNRFRVHGWRWHHLGIERDLLRLKTTASIKRNHLCSTSSQLSSTTTALNREQFLTFLQYIIQDNWRLHDYVEQKIFFPWLQRRDQSTTTKNHLSLISKERDRLIADSNGLVKRTKEWVYSPNENTCRRDRDEILERLDRLREHAVVLFKASEAVVIPRVLKLYTEKEQLQFNSTVLKNISWKEARMSLVIFRDAVDFKEPVVAEKEDFNDFVGSVPSAIRKLALPYWRKKFTDDKVRFLDQI